MFIINKKITFLLSLIISALILTVFLFYFGILQIHNPSRSKYPVHGVDISHYQGDIDWGILSSNNIDFAFIKATEGSSFVDPLFNYNYKYASDTNLLIGAYHFFSFESSGKDQAEHFINNVPKQIGNLPPVIDLEYYGNYFKNPPNKQDVHNELNNMIEILQDHYNVSPIIYVTHETYDRYIQGSYFDNPIWIRGVYGSSNLSDNRSWTFWQYSNRKKLDGYNGDERYLDMNVFYGDVNELKDLCIS